MRALTVESAGPFPILKVIDVPVPVPGPGEVLVKVAACGFCHHDRLVMAGVLRRGVKPGVILGHEISGEVAEVGEGVSALTAGDKVVSLLTNACGHCDRCQQGREHRCRTGQGIGHSRDGGFAEYVALSQHSLVPLPAHTDLITACIFACPMGVSLQGVQDVAQLRAGEAMLVTGAGGGLGVHAVQLGNVLGARVLAVTSSPSKVSRLEELGAAHVLEAHPGHERSSDTLDFSELALALTEDEGVHVAVDTVGSALFYSTWRSLSQYGRLVLLGEVTGQPVELNLAETIFRDSRIYGSSGTSRRLVEQVSDMVLSGVVRPVVSQVLPLEDAATAFDLVSSRKVLGRLLLTAQ